MQYSISIIQSVLNVSASIEARGAWSHSFNRESWDAWHVPQRSCLSVSPFDSVATFLTQETEAAPILCNTGSFKGKISLGAKPVAKDLLQQRSMAPMDTSDSDEVDQLPSVPRLRRSTSKPPVSSRESSLSKGKKREKRFSARRQKRESPRRHGKRRRKVENVHSDEDENEEDDSDQLQVRRTERIPRRTLQGRKIVDDDDEDDEDDESEDNGDGNVADDDGDRTDRGFDSKSNSSSPLRTKKRKGSARESSSDSKDDDGDEDALDNGEAEGSEIIPGQSELLARLEEENDDSEEFKSDDSEEEKELPKRPERLTSRQRAMQGENVQLEFSKLESPKSKKKEPTEEWDHDEEMELKKQQKARLRQMIHEKRNKEKRAAMVDKVLRGVTSKRKKFTMASEARAAQVGTRLSQNEMREGCIRFVSNRDGTTVSLPTDVETPPYLDGSVKAVYPPACKRDPKTGKRILAVE